MLSALHGAQRRGVVAEASKDAEVCGARDTILAALIGTILSQHTTAANARAAMDTLWAYFDGDYGRMHRAGPARVAEAIRVGGLGNVKAARICKLLGEVHASSGAYDLEHLRALGDDEIKTILVQFSGVGPKTASCVLLFALHRDDFAVDTHVLRICKQVGWIPTRASREQAYLHLDRRVPAALKYSLHVLLVHHGKCCPECAAGGRAQRPSEGPCPLVGEKRAAAARSPNLLPAPARRRSSTDVMHPRP